MSRVPIAVDRHGARRLAISSAKCDEPFHCGECGAACVLRQGLRRVHHFAHKAATDDTAATGCSGGGEGAMHEACKLFIKENIGSIVFARTCSECGEEVARWKGTEAVSEKDVLANGARYRVDLLAHNVMDSTEAVVEVMHTHRCSGDKLAGLASVFGDNVFEVESFDYEEATRDFNDDFSLVLSSVNRPRCSSCVTRAEGEEAQRRAAECRIQEAQCRRVQAEQRRHLEEKASAENQRRRLEEKAREEKQRRHLEEKAREENQRRRLEEKATEEKQRRRAGMCRGSSKTCESVPCPTRSWNDVNFTPSNGT